MSSGAEMRAQLAAMGITDLMGHLRSVPEVRETIRVVFPHRYSMPGWAHSPEDLAIQAHTHIAQEIDGYTPELWRVGLRSLVANGSRAYAVRPELMEALRRTRLDGADFAALTWPLAAFALVFPRGGAPMLDGDELASVLVAQVRGGDDARRMILLGSLTSGATITDHRSLAEANDVARELDMPHGGDADDARIEIGLMTGYVLKAMSYITARSDVAEGALQARAKRGKPDPRDWWRPWIIGDGYVRTGRAPQGGAHASPSMHWRAGHWRHQPCGPGRAQRRLIWIEPMLIGGRGEEAP